MNRRTPRLSAAQYFFFRPLKTSQALFTFSETLVEINQLANVTILKTLTYFGQPLTGWSKAAWLCVPFH